MTVLVRRQLMTGLGAALLGESVARAEDPPADRDRSVAENYRLPIADSDRIVAGATIGVNTAIADVKAILLSFARYKDILPRLQQSRVVAEENGVTDVYMRAPIMHGLSAIWGVMRFTPPSVWRKRGLQIAGNLTKGNMSVWTGKWMAFPCGEKRTLLKLELYIDIDVPVPVSLVNDQLLWACRFGVTSVRDMAECGATTGAG